jgi:hypothetical protein
MTDNRDSRDHASPETEPAIEIHGNRRGEKGGYYGIEYDTQEHRQPQRVGVGQRDAGMAVDPVETGEHPELPEDAGRRAHVDQRTGAVHGSGASAGGGTEGDDIDQDRAGGSGR